MLVETRCNLCDSDDFKVLAHVAVSPVKGHSTLVRCNNCGLAYVNPRHSVQREKQFYQSEYHEAHDDRIWRDARINIFKVNLAKIESRQQRGRILDVGCGRGYFLELARKNGWDTYGVELSRSASRHAREFLQLQIYEGELRDARYPDEFFDVITAWNVIDQLYDPYGELKEIHRILKREGMLALRLSNLTFHILLHRCSRVLNALTFGIVSFRAPTVFHLYMFSPASVKMVLEKAGFTDIRVENSPLDPEVPALTELVGDRGEKCVRYLVQFAIECIYKISFGMLVLGPSITVFARKGTSRY